MVGTESKEIENKARDEIKQNLKNRGVDARAVVLALQTGAEINIAEKKVVRFKPGAELSEKVK